MNFFLVDPHFMFGYVYAPVFYDLAHEFDGLILEQFLLLPFVEIVLAQDLLDKLSINIGALTLHRVEVLSV